MVLLTLCELSALFNRFLSNSVSNYNDNEQKSPLSEIAFKDRVPEPIPEPIPEQSNRGVAIYMRQ